MATSAIFNQTVVAAQDNNNQQDIILSLRLYRDVFEGIRGLYVDEVPVHELIENSIKGMNDFIVERDSTFVPNELYKDIINIIRIESPNQQQEFSRYLRLFQDVLLEFLGNEQIMSELTLKELIESAIVGMLSGLDPHTSFFTPEDFKRFTDSTMGEFGGLGITIDRQGDYVVVVSPIEGTPAYKMGIQAGDRIVSVDGENVVGMVIDDVISRMRGEPGTLVLIGIDRPGISNQLNFEIIREIIRTNSISYSFVLENGVGYIRISQFNANTTNDFREALDLLEAEGISGLLIDLRSNPGGLLNEAVDMINEFIGRNRRVVFTRGRARGTNREYFTTHNRNRPDYPVIALINQASASASEIFSGSLQDWDRGLVVGMPSYGKGSVQQLFPLIDGHGLKVTISKYYINSGRCIHKDINDRLLRGEEVSQEEREAIERENEANIYYTVNGREVIGGGGIIPDIEINQSLMTNFEIEIRRMNLLFEYSMEYYTSNRDNISIDFKVTDELVKDFLSYGEAKGLEFTQADIDSSYVFIEMSLTRDIISRAHGTTEGYKAAIPLDTQLMEAISLFDRFKTMDEMFRYAANR